jgi:hypothetical protein
MNPGLLTAIDPTTAALALGAGIVMFSEETQRLLCIRMNTKAAQAAGIGALASRAIDTGDHAEALEFIVSLANDLASEIQHLANVAGQITASKAA